jgi:hypothetical protein
MPDHEPYDFQVPLKSGIVSFPRWLTAVASLVRCVVAKLWILFGIAPLDFPHEDSYYE